MRHNWPGARVSRTPHSRRMRSRLTPARKCGGFRLRAQEGTHRLSRRDELPDDLTAHVAICTRHQNHGLSLLAGRATFNSLSGALAHRSNDVPNVQRLRRPRDIGKRRARQPALETFREGSRAVQLDRLSTNRLTHRDVAHGNLGHGTKVGNDIKIDLVTRVLNAKINVVRCHDQPPFVDPPIPFFQTRPVREFEPHDAPLGRKVAPVDPTTQVPHQKIHIELVIAEPISYPTLPPCSIELNDRSDLKTGLCRRILNDSGFRSGSTHDKPKGLEALQPTRKQRRRHAGDATADLIEAPGTAQDVSQEQQGPPLTEDFHRSCDGTILSVSLHGIVETIG